MFQVEVAPVGLGPSFGKSRGLFYLDHLFIPVFQIGTNSVYGPDSRILLDEADTNLQLRSNHGLTDSLPYPASLTPFHLRAFPQQIICTRIPGLGSASRHLI